jgi:hypothetical protein
MVHSQRGLCHVLAMFLQTGSFAFAGTIQLKLTFSRYDSTSNESLWSNTVFVAAIGSTWKMTLNSNLASESCWPLLL